MTWFFRLILPQACMTLMCKRKPWAWSRTGLAQFLFSTPSKLIFLTYSLIFKMNMKQRCWVNPLLILVLLLIWVMVTVVAHLTTWACCKLYVYKEFCYTWYMKTISWQRSLWLESTIFLRVISDTDVVSDVCQGFMIYFSHENWELKTSEAFILKKTLK